ncbi:MAG: hypothetical protein VYC17_04055 [Nitrospinota bacterium]|nr:hypothetical protein [Nitrospinota bacterium]
MNYKIIDPLIAAMIGGLAVIIAVKAVPTSSNMLLGMLLGGLCGMALQVVLMLPLMILFGAFEVMIPFALIAMPVGMLSGMAVTGTHAKPFEITCSGAFFGLLVAVFIYFYNRKLANRS